MSDIPDGVRELAKDYVRQNFESLEPWSMTIARAILAERERCAKVAEKRAQEYEEAYEETEFKAHSMGGSAALIAIASRIRSGS